MPRNAIPRPFLKWVGGKSQLIPELLARMPARFQGYHEPFLGGGALFFNLYRRDYITKATLSDINRELIDTYLAVRTHVEEIIELLETYPLDKSFYYDMRSKDPWRLPPPERAARMIYLNKTGYNGLYRVNRQGIFNVPYGRYKTPQYKDFENLRAASMALRIADIICASFEDVLERATAGDWVYFDPPYIPISESSSFTSYQPNGFSYQRQKDLRDVCLELHKKHVFVTISNSSADLVYKLYEKPPFHIWEVLARRAINSKGNRRGKIKELIITTYPPSLFIQPRLLEQQGSYTSLHPTIKDTK
ncbi:MAG: DNA adenine methylase [Methanobacteriota archaeon]|nr:MAG: DNA adenine methylase [Euryarchaeota archaeon]